MLSTVTSSTARMSWEYLMPQRKERALIYVRESDISLAMDSTTVESAIKALMEHAERKGYIVSPEHVFREAISGYHTYYFDRPELMKALKVCERNEVDVFLVTEIRALSRRGAGEVLVIYNSLQKSAVRLETLNESITDDPMGEVLLTFRATWARIEREQSYIRMQRGKKDRIEIGHAPGNGHKCYGFTLIDTEKETSAKYVFNTTVIYVDPNGEEWSEMKARKFILESLLQGATLRGVSKYLNDLGVPPPKISKKREKAGEKSCWVHTSIRNMVVHPINYGVVYAHTHKLVGKKMVKRPEEEWIQLPAGTAPALITKEQHNKIMANLKNNRNESLRNNRHTDELGLLRGGYIFCAVCQHRMTICYGGSNGRKQKSLKLPYYLCSHREGSNVSAVHNHITRISLRLIDDLVKEKIIEVLLQPEEVRKKVDAIRQAMKPVVNQQEVQGTLDELSRKMRNIYKLAENATDDETIVHLGERMQELEQQKRETEKLLFVLEDNEEERVKIEEEVVKFEAWAKEVQPFLTDKAYMEKATYAELRLAIKILGIQVLVYPTVGDYPFRHQILVTVPEILAKSKDCVLIQPIRKA